MPKGVRKNNKLSTKKDFVLKDDDQVYAQVIRKLGDSRLLLQLENGSQSIGIIRGKMKKRQWIHVHNWVIASVRDFQPDKYDIIHVYNDEEVKQLYRLNELSNDNIHSNSEDSIIWSDTHDDHPESNSKLDLFKEMEQSESDIHSTEPSAYADSNTIDIDLI